MTKWIPVAERMPDCVGCDVLVFMPGTYSRIGIEMVYRTNNGEPCFAKGWNKGEGQFEVTHWMRLPAEPKT